MRVLLGIAVLSIVISCTQTEIRYKKSYFDFDSLVTQQVKSLAKSKWRKISTLNKKADTVSIQPDSLQWSNELDAFRQLDAINKPVLKGNYTVEEKKDIHSNLTIRSFKLKITNREKLKSSVPFVDFYYFNQVSDLRRIVAVYEESNMLFSSRRQLSLEFEEGTQKKLIGYKISGFQKMMLTDSVLLNIKSERVN
jgi:hypothetical protein